MKKYFKIVSNQHSIRVVFVITTFIILGVSLFFFLDHQRKKNRYEHLKAVKFSEYAFQNYMINSLNVLQKNPMMLRGVSETEYAGGTYSVEVETSIRQMDSSEILLTIRSNGRFRSQSVQLDQKQILLHRSVLMGDTTWIPIEE